jgi:hypothetical protein
MEALAIQILYLSPKIYPRYRYWGYVLFCFRLK